MLHRTDTHDFPSFHFHACRGICASLASFEMHTLKATASFLDSRASRWKHSQLNTPHLKPVRQSTRAAAEIERKRRTEKLGCRTHSVWLDLPDLSECSRNFRKTQNIKRDLRKKSLRTIGPGGRRSRAFQVSDCSDFGLNLSAKPCRPCSWKLFVGSSFLSAKREGRHFVKPLQPPDLFDAASCCKSPQRSSFLGFC